METRTRTRTTTEGIGAEQPQIADVRLVLEAVSAAAGDDAAVDPPLYEVEILCMRCGQNGVTRLLLTVIPHFRKILLAAFECPHCGKRNNEVQFAGGLQPRGSHYRLEISSGDRKMLNRQVVKSESATIKIPELEFEIPPEAQHGSLSTILREYMALLLEIVLMIPKEANGKTSGQGLTSIEKDVFKGGKLLHDVELLSLEEPWTLIINDALANFFVAPATDNMKDDHQLAFEEYERSCKQNEELGLNHMDTSSADVAYAGSNGDA